jgi:hypothetical protein
MAATYPTWNLEFEGHLMDRLIAAHNPRLHRLHTEVRPPKTAEECKRLGDYFTTVAGLDVFIFESTVLGINLIKDPAFQLLLTRQISDDGAHAEIMRRRIEHLTGMDPIRQIKERAEQQWEIVGDIPRRGLLGFLAFEIEYEINIVPDIVLGWKTARINDVELHRAGEDRFLPDEAFHRQFIAAWLTDFLSHLSERQRKDIVAGLFAYIQEFRTRRAQFYADYRRQGYEATGGERIEELPAISDAWNYEALAYLLGQSTPILNTVTESYAIGASA